MMKRRSFVQLSLAGMPLSMAANAPAAANDDREWYEWRNYEMRFGGNRVEFDNYFSKALIPFLNQQGVKKVGVFSEMGKDDPAHLHVLLVYPSIQSFATIQNLLNTDQGFLELSKNYQKSAPERPIFNRYTTSLMQAFNGLKQMIAPPPGARIFEWRLYEGYNEDAVRRKVKMFNDEELPVFVKTKLNSVFFGEVVAGTNMPCLAYMLTFKDIAERDANWANFIKDPEWKRMSADPQYAHTVSNIVRKFLEPLPYSQI